MSTTKVLQRRVCMQRQNNIRPTHPRIVFNLTIVTSKQTVSYTFSSWMHHLKMLFTRIAVLCSRWILFSDGKNVKTAIIQLITAKSQLSQRQYVTLFTVFIPDEFTVTKSHAGFHSETTSDVSTDLRKAFYRHPIYISKQFPLQEHNESICSEQETHF